MFTILTVDHHSTALIPNVKQVSLISMKWIIDLPWHLIILACISLGLAPFNPPHILEKLQMLFNGTLHKPVDIFDLLMHATPWLLLILKTIAVLFFVPTSK